MKKILNIVLIISLIGQINAQNQNTMTPTKKLVAYFSCTGTTKSAAEKLAQYIGADLYEIKPEKLYTTEDLNWNNPKSRSSIEMKDPTSRPKISPQTLDMTLYDVVFVGYPIWWNLAPTIVNTFLETYDFTQKTVIPFATSGSSTISHSAQKLRETYPQIHWLEGRLIKGGIDQAFFK